MQELIARLEAAEVGSRELDARLWDLEDDRPRHDLDGDGAIYKRDPEDTVAFDSPPAYTTSLDAALALAERVLEQPYPWVGKNRGSPLVAAWSCELVTGDDFRSPAIETDAPTPALALCIAILKAKAQGEGG